MTQDEFENHRYSVFDIVQTEDGKSYEIWGVDFYKMTIAIRQLLPNGKIKIVWIKFNILKLLKNNA